MDRPVPQYVYDLGFTDMKALEDKEKEIVREIREKEAAERKAEKEAEAAKHAGEENYMTRDPRKHKNAVFFRSSLVAPNSPAFLKARRPYDPKWSWFTYAPSIRPGPARRYVFNGRRDDDVEMPDAAAAAINADIDAAYDDEPSRSFDDFDDFDIQALDGAGGLDAPPLTEPDAIDESDGEGFVPVGEDDYELTNQILASLRPDIARRLMGVAATFANPGNISTKPAEVIKRKHESLGAIESSESPSKMQKT